MCLKLAPITFRITSDDAESKMFIFLSRKSGIQNPEMKIDITFKQTQENLKNNKKGIYFYWSNHYMRERGVKEGPLQETKKTVSYKKKNKKKNFKHIQYLIQ